MRGMWQMSVPMLRGEGKGLDMLVLWLLFWGWMIAVFIEACEFDVEIGM